MEDALYRGNREPRLDQILAEPIVQTIMRSDGADAESIRQLMRKAADAVKPPDPPKLHFTPPVPAETRNGNELPQASIGVLARAGASRWPRVFPSL